MLGPWGFHAYFGVPGTIVPKVSCCLGSYITSQTQLEPDQHQEDKMGLLLSARRDKGISRDPFPGVW